jgi:hypothetical protein
MKIKNIKLIFVYVAAGILGTISYFLSFWTDLFVSENVLFFRPLMLLIMITLVTGCILLFIKKRGEMQFLTYRDIIIILILFLFGNNYLYGHIAFNASRSNSMILIRFLYDQQGIHSTEEEISLYVQNKYFHEYKAIKVRLYEQMELGNINKIDGGYYLTKKGSQFVEYFGFFASLYNLDNNFLLSESEQE